MNKREYCKSKICQRDELAKGIYKLTFATDVCEFERPGQYAMIVVDGIATPYQVCDFDSNRFTIVADTDYAEGAKLSSMEYGQELMTMTGLGQGFDMDAIPDDACLVADSLGIPEILVLARNLLTRGLHNKVVLGYPTKEEMFMVDAFRSICNEMEILTLDGSNGREGSASDAVMKAGYVCASGTVDMIKALASKAADGQFSFSNLLVSGSDEGSGLGMTMVQNGPVFKKNEIGWELI